MISKSSQSKNENMNDSTQNSQAGTVEVLYQKMGNRWYAFSVVGEEVFMGAIPEELIGSDGQIDPNVSKEKILSTIGNS